MKKLKIEKHWIILILASLLYGGTIGLVNNTFGIYYTPVSEQLNILRGTFAMNATVSSIFTGVVSLFAPRLIERFSWKRILIVGVVLASAGVFSMGLTTNVLIFNILGAIRGTGIALAAMVPGAALINNWFEEKNGLAISILTSATGVASVVFSPIFARLIHLIGWENTFFVHGALILLFSLPIIFYPHSFHPLEEDILPYGATPKDLVADGDVKLEGPVKPKEYLGITFFVFLAVVALQISIGGLSQHLPGYGESIGMTIQVGGFMLSAVMSGNMLFKLFSGALSDKIGTIKTMFSIVALNVMAIFILATWKSPIGLIISSFLFGSIFGTGVLYVLLSKTFFGRRVGNYVYSYTTFIANIAYALSNAAIGYVYDFTGSYQSVFGIAIGIQIIASILILVAIKYAPNLKLTKQEIISN